MRRVWLALIGLSCATVGLNVATSPASADPLCYFVGTTGTVVGTHAVGPICEPTSFGTICETETVGLDPSALVTEEVCVSRP